MSASAQGGWRVAAYRTGGFWINLHTTEACNLKCSYCYLTTKGKGQPTYDLASLRELVETRHGNVTICFYGGEPTLNLPYMTEVMGTLRGKASFALQTNGTLLDTLPDDMLARFVSIGVSIDGAPEVTDATRGPGVFDRIVRNVERVSPKVRVPIMARMTLTERNDLRRDIEALAPHFGAIYWQIDNDLWRREHTDFLRRYVAALPEVVDVWETHAQAGRIVNLVPFFGVYWLMTRGAATRDPYPHCEPGKGSITIDTAGTIYSCPEGVARGGAASGAADVIGTLADYRDRWPYMEAATKASCASCDILPICGGRCIWTDHPLYCEATRALVDTVRTHAARLWAPIDAKRLKAMNAVALGTEIIP